MGLSDIWLVLLKSAFFAVVDPVVRVGIGWVAALFSLGEDMIAAVFIIWAITRPGWVCRYFATVLALVESIESR